MTIEEINQAPVGTKVCWVEHDHMNKHGDIEFIYDEISDIKKRVDEAGWAELKFHTIKASRVALNEKDALKNDLATILDMERYYNEYDSIPSRNILDVLAIERAATERHLREIENV